MPGTGCSHLCWQQVTSSYGKEQDQSKDVQLFIWLCLLVGREFGGFFLVAQGRAACPGLSHSLGLPRDVAALLTGGVLFVS